MKKRNIQLPEGKGRGRNKLEYGINRYTLLYIQHLNNKDLQYNTEQDSIFCNNL